MKVDKKVEGETEGAPIGDSCADSKEEDRIKLIGRVRDGHPFTHERQRRFESQFRRTSGPTLRSLDLKLSN